jgi:hypothetical protein
MVRTSMNISRLAVPARDAMPEDIRARILAVQERSGVVGRLPK